MSPLVGPKDTNALLSSVPTLTALHGNVTSSPNMENMSSSRSPRESIFCSVASYPKSFLDAYNEDISPMASKDGELGHNGPEQEQQSTVTNDFNSHAVSFGKRYKMSLTLKPREIELARLSWSILLDNECSNEKYETFINKSLKKRKNGASHPTQNPQFFRTEGSNTAIAGNDTCSSFLFGTQFLANILELAPELHDAFPTLKHAASAVTGVLMAAVNNLEDLSVLDEYLCGLGKRHSRILGVYAEHFRIAGAGFVKTLRDRFGFDMTRELEDIWLRVYLYLSNTMLQFGIDPVITETLSFDIALEAPSILEMEPMHSPGASYSRSESNLSFEPVSLRSGISSQRSNYNYTTSSGGLRYSTSTLTGTSAKDITSKKTNSSSKSNKSSSSPIPKSVRGGGGSTLKPGGKWVPISSLPRNTYNTVILEEISHKGGSVRGGGSSYRLVHVDVSQRAKYASQTGHENPSSTAIIQRRQQVMREHAARPGGARGGGGGNCTIM
ncbi:LAME_0B08042g1_1 [Lachancea meyersii CBS 8951]|uniref:LAME_0B08042g1_1 n=1 Tax=Lachancea meyersii CBS 8951 TaxID=1266667 RepID=A0A1G4IXM7_9SACH|nr:LAME_0B08042g1_1 [Lachancea meyersii CBS 8951]